MKKGKIVSSPFFLSLVAPTFLSPTAPLDRSPASLGSLVSLLMKNKLSGPLFCESEAW